MFDETRAPWHHFLVTILAALFYAIGALDYVLTKLQAGFYVSNFNETQATFFAEMPFWLDAIWAIGVFGGLFGTWLLWNRNRFAVLFLFAGFASIAFLTVWLSIFTRPTLFGVTGFMGVYTLVGTSALAFLLYTYARWERTEYYLL